MYFEEDLIENIGQPYLPYDERGGLAHSLLNPQVRDNAQFMKRLERNQAPQEFQPTNAQFMNALSTQAARSQRQDRRAAEAQEFKPTNEQFMNALAHQAVRSQREDRLNAPQGRTNAQQMANLARKEPVEQYSNEQFMGALAREATKSQARDEIAKAAAAPKKTKRQARKVAKKAIPSVSADIRASDPKPSHAQRLAMLDPNYANDDEYGITY